ncbi:DUF6392 family protein (plasmid) [Chimaeribacter arupi]|uniref:DUF6392 family protein n=1 Tax=Chimaeribacter arupi TaxID=2060066 RepID=UPI002711FB97|nr:DUF6392 family protein [Chimaeribacter arupi]WKZ94662.1 DUF6392 family protein [Chimaeribacter arupi]
MTVNVDALIRSLGKKYKELVDSGLINYKSSPKGASGSPTISLDMAKEGVFLAFRREGRILKEITLSIQHDTLNKWTFPNALPTPLQKSMSRQWVHENVGEPENSIPPRVIMRQAIGWIERFTLEDFHTPLTMVIRYDMADMVASVTFLPTSDLRW